MRAARRLVAVGTTSVRTLESAAAHGAIEAASGETDIFIYPGFEFRATGAMLTNFHLPRTSLLLLVCAFGGTDLALEAYRHAVEPGIASTPTAIACCCYKEVDQLGRRASVESGAAWNNVEPWVRNSYRSMLMAAP